MNALDLIHEHHEQMKTLLDKTLKQNEPAEREHLLDHLRSQLVIHERMEEEILYPALHKSERAKDIVLEGYEEHHVVDVLLDELMDIPPDIDLWQAKVKVLKENVEHHIEEEEDELFKNAKKVLDREQLDDLGAQMEALRRESAA